MCCGGMTCLLPLSLRVSWGNTTCFLLLSHLASEGGSTTCLLPLSPRVSWEIRICLLSLIHGCFLALVWSPKGNSLRSLKIDNRVCRVFIKRTRSDLRADPFPYLILINLDIINTSLAAVIDCAIILGDNSFYSPEADYPHMATMSNLWNYPQCARSVWSFWSYDMGML